MSNLRNKLIRLAYEKPALRTHLLPLVASEKVTIVLDFDEIKKTTAIVAKFLSPIKLYRVIDGEELMDIIKKGSIKGGEYSTPDERAYGAQWGANKEEVVKWGMMQQGQRLGHELFLLEIEGNGKTFFNLNQPKRERSDSSPLHAIHKAYTSGNTEPFSIDASLCSTGLGCSVQVQASEVLKWYQIENRTSVEKTFSAIKEIAESGTLGKKPREITLYGVVPANLPKSYLKPLVYHWGNWQDHEDWGLRRNYYPNMPDWVKLLKSKNTLWSRAEWSQSNSRQKEIQRAFYYSLMSGSVYFLVQMTVETTVEDFKVSSLPLDSVSKVHRIEVVGTNKQAHSVSGFGYNATLVVSKRGKIKFVPS